MKAVTVFRADESEYHKYAAVVAATEPYRDQLVEDIKAALNPVSLLFCRIRGLSLEDPSSTLRIENKKVDSACAAYERKVDDIVKSFDMTVEEFNDISNRIEAHGSLRRRIMLQAYYYKVAADLSSEVKSHLPNLPAMSVPIEGPKGKKVQEQISVPILTPLPTDSKLTSFCKVLHNVENVRKNIKEQLIAQLGVTRLPDNFCDADVYPTMCKTVQQACIQFPKTATAFMVHHGLDEAEFQSLQEKMQRNLLFKMRVRGEIAKLERV
jgi:hypothetical protein